MGIDILFLHVPKSHSFYKPIGDYTFILYPPVGLLALADYIQKKQFKTAIVDLNVEQRVQGRIDLAKLLSEYNPRVVGLDLHWHFQAFDVIEVAKQIKHINAAIHIVLGGFTASYFAEEILSNFSAVDSIIRGDAEVPLIEFIQCITTGTSICSVSNLAYREHGQIFCSPISYIADDTILDQLDFTNFSLIRNHSLFPKMLNAWVMINGLSLKTNKILLGNKTGYPVFLGRGCLKRCSFCGGSRGAQVQINNRKRISVRSVATVIKSIVDIEKAGFDFAYFNYDPLPVSEAERFYSALFKQINQLNTQLSFEVERWSLPTDSFIKEFKMLLNANSFISISANSHSEEVRKKNNMYFFSNIELENCLNTIQETGVQCLLHFMCGLPFEKKSDLFEMSNYQRTIKERFPDIRIRTCMVEIEPGSEMSRNPGKYEIIPERSSFIDYYDYHSQHRTNHYQTFGYDRQLCPDQIFVSKHFCRYLCSRFNNRFNIRGYSVFLCTLMALLRTSGVFKLADRVVQMFPENPP